MTQKLIYSLLILTTFGSASAYGQGESDVPPVAQITHRVLEAARHYAVAVSCVAVAPNAKSVAALSAWKDLFSRDGEYLVFWFGDIGCAGGSRTVTANAALVKIGAGETFYVDPTRSSPMIELEISASMERLVGNTKDTIVIDGAEYGPNDANCCPSMRFRYTLRADSKGNWRISDKRKLPPKH